MLRNGACSVRRLRFELLHSPKDNGGRSCSGSLQAQEVKREGESSATTIASTTTETEATGIAFLKDDDPFFYAGAVETRNQSGGAEEPSSGKEVLPSPPTTASSSPSSSSSPPSPLSAAAAAVATIGERDDDHCLGCSSCSSCSSSRGGSNATACGGTVDDEHGMATMIEVCAAESISLGGFFGTVWDCSLKMGAFLASLGPGALRGKRVVELGAGCGAVSALCAALGASEVVATDAKDLLPLLTFNLDRNKCQGSLNVKVGGCGAGHTVARHTI